MKNKRKIVSSFLALLSSFSLVSAKNENIKMQNLKCVVHKNKKDITSKNKFILISSLLLASTALPIMFRNEIINAIKQNNEPKRDPYIDPQRTQDKKPNKENHIYQNSNPKFSESSVDNIKFSVFEKLIFDDSMVEKINTTGSKISKYYPKCEKININYDDPGSIMGKNFDETDMRSNPKKYFFQDQDDYIYVKDMYGQLHCTGKMIVPSLEDLLKQSKNIINKNGTINIVYGNTNLLDIHNILDSEVFQFANPASNFNAIETLGPGDLSKFFQPYCSDHTQGPWFMKKCPWTSLFLLHVLNGVKNSDKNSPVINNSAKNLFQIMSNGQFEFNLLGDYEVKTSAGYAESPLPSNFTDPNNDKLYRSLIVENAPISLSGKEYTYSGDTRLIDIYIDATIPKSYGEKSYKKNEIIQHLFRHYMSIIAYCKSKGIKNAILSLTGCGVFNVPVDWHIEVLTNNKIQDEIKRSGTNFIINGYGETVKAINNYKTIGMVSWTNVSNVNQINCVNIKDINSWADVFKKLNIN